MVLNLSLFKGSFLVQKVIFFSTMKLYFHSLHASSSS